MKKCFWLIVAVLLFTGCTKHIDLPPDPASFRKVFLMYEDGFNNLVPYMQEDITDISLSAPSSSQVYEYALLVFRHFTAAPYDYTTPTESYLEQIFYDGQGKPYSVTVRTYPATCHSSSAEMIRQVLTDVKNLYPAAEYGMLYSSHGTGWLPEEYYDTHDVSDIWDDWSVFRPKAFSGRIHPLFCDPQTKSMGCEAYYISGELHTREIELYDLDDAFPFKLDYLLLDACLMGGVETAYQLRNAADVILFSQTEVMANGFPYKSLLQSVMYSPSPDYVKVCDDFCKENSSGSSISAVHTSQMENVAQVCKILFEKYSSEIANVNPDLVQGFFRYNKAWFYDLRDIFIKSGISEADLSLLDDALNSAIFHVRHTATFLQDFDIYTDCGFSMFLPSNGSDLLKEHYKKLEWNKVTGLVK